MLWFIIQACQDLVKMLEGKVESAGSLMKVVEMLL